MDNPYKIYIRTILQSGNLFFQGDENQIAEALNAGFIKQTTEPEGYTIDVTCPIFINTVIEVAEDDLNESYPPNISGSIAFISRYEAWLNGSSAFNRQAFSVLIEPFKLYSLVKLHNEKQDDLITFYYSYSQEDENSDLELWRFDEYFFMALPHLNINEATICQILLLPNKTERQQQATHEKSEFAIKFAATNYPAALKLFEYGKNNKLGEQANLLALLLAGLHNNGYDDAVNEAKLLFEINQNVAIIFFGAIKNNVTSKLIDYIVSLSNKINKDDVEVVRNYGFTIQKLLQSPVTEKQTENIFQIYFDLLSLQNEAIVNNISGYLSWYIHGFEQQRYDLLRAALNNKFFKGHVIKNYFHNFTNPKYFFEFFSVNYSVLKDKINIELFEDGFDHFVDINYAATESEIFNLIAHKDIHLRVGVLKLWVNSRSRRKQLNLLSLDSEIKQLRAIEALIAFPYGINEIMPSLLILRKSPHSIVVTYLTQSLWVLVFEAYHEHAYKLIEANLENTDADKMFLNSIKQSLDTYEQMKEMKKAIKDLDPWANEKSAVQLYYKLEHEKQAKSINEITNDEHSFLKNSAKTVEIVRGHSWKIEGHDVAALANFETSIPLDIRMYKNPDQYEINLKYLQTKWK